MAIQLKKRQSKETLRRLEAEATEEAEAQAAFEAEGLAEVEKIGRTWGLAPEEIEVILKGKYYPLFLRARQAQRDIEKRGLVSFDNYGRSRANPSISIEKDSIGGMMRILKALNIGGETPEPATKTKPWGNTHG
jgi:hypothetical protein